MFGTSTCIVYVAFLQRNTENIDSILNSILKLTLDIFVENETGKLP